MRSNGLVLVCATLVLALSACKDKGNPIDGAPPIIEINYPPIDQYPTWSSDGTRIMYYHLGITRISTDGSYTINPDSAGLWMVNADGTNPHLILRGWYIYVHWSSDGQWIVFEQGAQIYKAPVVGDSLDASQIIQLTFEGRNFFPAWSLCGQWIAYDSNVESPNGMNFVWTMKSDGSGKRRIVYEPTMGEIRMPHWSPDGKQIVHIRYLVGTLSSEIFSMDSSGANPRRLTQNSATDYYPKYSPDRTKIAFQSQSEGDVPQVWVMNGDGNDPRKLTTNGGESPTWSPDANRIVYVYYNYRRRDTRNGTLWIMSADGSSERQLTFGPS